MRRLLRILFNGLTILSLLLCVVTCVLWARSYSKADFVNIAFGTQPQVYVSLDSTSAQMCVGYRLLEDAMFDGRFEWRTRNAGGPSYPPAWSTFEKESEAFDGCRALYVFLPAWSLAALFGIVPTVHLIRRMRRQRLNRIGHCPSCGYDLRATPGRCPECGAVAPAKAVA